MPTQGCPTIEECKGPADKNTKDFASAKSIFCEGTETEQTNDDWNVPQLVISTILTVVACMALCNSVLCCVAGFFLVGPGRRLYFYLRQRISKLPDRAARTLRLLTGSVCFGGLTFLFWLFLRVRLTSA
jgi:hypothetical protein